MDTLPSTDLQGKPNPWANVFEPEQPKFSVWGLLARRKWLILLCVVIGLGLAYLYFTQAEERFQSTAKVRIRPRNQAQVTLVQNDQILPGQESILKRHDKDILSERTVSRCFEQSPEIERMSIFDGLSVDERLRQVLTDLEVDRDKEDGEVFELAFTATNAMDAKTMLNSILATYEKELELQFSSESDRVVTTFKGVKQYLQEYIDAREKIREDIAARAKANNVSDIVVDTGNLTLHNRKVGEVMHALGTLKVSRAKIGAEIQWIRDMLVSQATPEGEQAAESAAAISDAAMQQMATDQTQLNPNMENPLAAEPPNLTTPAMEESSVQTQDSTGEVAANPAATDTPSTEPAQDSSATAANQEPAPGEDPLANPPPITEELNASVQVLKNEMAQEDPVPGWIAEIFEKLKNPNPAASGLVLTLALNRKIDRTTDYNSSFVPNSRLSSDKTRAEMEFQQQIDKLIIDRDLKALDLGAKHPEIMVLDQTIERYREAIARLDALHADLNPENMRKPISDENFLAAYVNDLALRYNEVVSQLPDLVKDFDEHYAKAAMLVDISRQLKDADEEVRMFREFLQETVATLAQINPRYIDQGYVDQDKEGFVFIRLDEPSLGERVWPDLLILLALGGLLGSMIGFGLGYLVELSDKTFHNPDEIMRQLSMPLIGHIPVIQQSKRHVIENSYIDPSICVYHRPKAQASEAFRAIRTALFFSTKGKTNSVIQVTSPTPGDGKSTIAANLAVSIAQSGKRVLLLDADMRRPSIHHAFGIKTQEGFPQVLLGEKTWRSAVYECEEIPGLSILPCGAKPTNPAELISTPRVGELIEEMRHHFDFIIMDTPPVLAVTDPCPVAARVDGVILTIRIKKNVKISSDRATEVLHSVGANLIGVVVNGVGNQSGYGSQYSYGAYRAGYQYNGYGYGYGYSYGYGKRTDDEKPGRTAPLRNLQAPASSDAGVSP